MRTSAHPRWLFGCFAVSAAALAWCTTARADVPVAYHADHADESCPSAETFFASLREHASESWSAAAAGAWPRSFSVDIEREPEKFLGRFTSLEHGEPVAERRISARSCADLVEAMAVVAALAIDAEARIVTAAHRHRAVVLPSPHLVAHSLVGPTTDTALAVRLGVGGGVTTATGSAAPTVDTSVEVLWPTRIHPSLALAASLAVASADTNPGSVTLTRYELVASACPFRAMAGRVVELAPCARLGVGFERPSVHGLAEANESAQPWVAPGLDVRGFVWWGLVGLRLVAGFEVPLFQPTFTTNVRPLFTTPSVAVDAAISLVIRTR